MSLTNLSPQQLRQAADLQEQIFSLQEQLGELLGSGTPGKTAVAPVQVAEQSAAPTDGRKRKKFSAASRAKMRLAQQARWARIKGTTAEPAPEAPKKRKLSAKGLANIRAGVAKRTAKKSAPPVASLGTPKKARSAAWKKALSLAMKKRWEAKRAEGKSSL